MRLPSEQEVEPWYDAICALWDDPALVSLRRDPGASGRRRALQRGGIAPAPCRLFHVIETGRPSDRGTRQERSLPLVCDAQSNQDEDVRFRTRDTSSNGSV